MPTLKDRASDASLSEKQLEVLELLERRLTISEIAYELGVSDSAINQRIRVLKLRFGVNSHRELVARYRSAQDHAYRDSAARNPQLSNEHDAMEPALRGNQGSVFRFEDSQAFPLEEPWSRREQPEVVPEVLDGKNAGEFRLVAIVLVLIGMFAAVIVALAAAKALTELF